VADLKLGRLPKQGMVRLTIVLSEPLKEELDAYAAEHGKLYGPIETTALIPHMLEALSAPIVAGAAAENGWSECEAVNVEPVQPGTPLAPIQKV